MEKYKSYVHFLLAKVYKDFRRYQISKLISWDTPAPIESGCTVVIAMCSRIPYILPGVLECLWSCRWEELKEVIVVVDAEPGSLPTGFEGEIKQKLPQLKLTFLYYNHQQAKYTTKVGDPFIYAWLSWTIGFNYARTKTVFIQDYDALVLSREILGKRYQAFIESGAKIQGIRWFDGTVGLMIEDHLATTFEAFVDVNWIRSFPPVIGYHKIGRLKGRQVCYDMYDDIQANHTPENQRTIMPMPEEDLAHTSEMIVQYMKFKKTPGKVLPCFSIIMIPFFYWLSGQKKAITNATQALHQQGSTSVDLLSDGVLINLSLLKIIDVDWILKNIIQVMVKKDIKPFKDIIDYGTALYQACNTPPEQIWVGDFTDVQREWIHAAKAL
jgi:hypothetical protein